MSGIVFPSFTFARTAGYIAVASKLRSRAINSHRDSTQLPPVSRKEIVGWAFYDFANSGYATVVMTTIYSAYFVGVVAGQAGLEGGTPTFLWTLAMALANFIVLFSGPAVGAAADQHACKKRFLLLTTLLCASGTAALALAGPGEYSVAFAIVVVATVAFASGENLVAAFLPEISRPENMGRISGYGWSFGYFGGLLTLACCLAYIQWASGNGQTPEQYVPVTLMFTALIFLASATPTFAWLRERAVPKPQGEASAARAALSEVINTLRSARHYRDLFRFLLCLTLVQSGVATVITLAAVYAQEAMGFDSQQLIVLVMLVNVTAAAGAFLFGFAQDRFGSIRCLAVAILIWIAAVLTAYVASAPWQVWLSGNLIGLAMGSTQAGGRALIGRFTPVARSGEFFGLWGLATRAAMILGPLSYGLISWASGGDHRLALLSTLTFFVVGLGLLFGVDESRGTLASQTEPT